MNIFQVTQILCKRINTKKDNIDIVCKNIVEKYRGVFFQKINIYDMLN